MPSHASISIIGHIAEPKFSGEGDKIVARFGLAVTRKRKDGDLTTWYNVTCWRKDAQFIQQYVKKGALLLVEGEPYQEEYQGKQYLKVDARKVVNLTAKEMPIVVVDDPPVPSPKPRVPAPAAGDDQPPFNRPLIADFWG